MIADRWQGMAVEDRQSVRTKPTFCEDFNVDASSTFDSLRPGWDATRVRSALMVSRPKSN